jgi:hypothetical protein
VLSRDHRVADSTKALVAGLPPAGAWVAALRSCAAADKQSPRDRHLQRWKRP